MNTVKFALSGFNYDVIDFVKSVKTKRWTKLHKEKLYKYASSLTSANKDVKQVIGCMLHCAYGVNIGEQILAKLSDEDLSKIKSNILDTCY